MCCRYWADESPELREIMEEMNRSPLVNLLWPMPVSDLLFAGHAAVKRLNQEDIHTIGDLAQSPKERLYELLGKQASFELSASGQFIDNPGTVAAEPVITVYGSGEITLMVDQTIVELDGVDGSITIDSTLQEAYTGTTLHNESMSGDFPLLKPGANGVSWTGNVTKIVIKPNWRYL